MKAKVKIKAWGNPENIETLKAMWNAEYSIADIAAAVGATRMQVSRKAYRMNLAKRANIGYSPKPIKGLRKNSPKNLRVDPTPLKTMAQNIVEGSKPVILDLRTGCCFPVNDGGPFLFCNEPCEGSYCSHHKAVMTDRPRYSHHGPGVRKAHYTTYT